MCVANVARCSFVSFCALLLTYWYLYLFVIVVACLFLMTSTSCILVAVVVAMVPGVVIVVCCCCSTNIFVCTLGCLVSRHWHGDYSSGKGKGRQFV